MKSQIFSTFVIVLVAQSQLALAEPQPFLDLGGLLTTDLVGKLPLVGDLLGDDGLFGGLLDGDLLDGLLTLIPDLVDNLLSLVLPSLDGQLDSFSTKLDEITNNSTSALEGTSGDFDAIIDAAPGIVQATVDGAYNTMLNLTCKIGTAVDSILAQKQTLKAGELDAIYSTISSIQSKVADPWPILKKLIDAIETVVAAVLEKLAEALDQKAPEDVIDAVKNLAAALNENLYEYVGELSALANPAFTPLDAICPALVGNLENLITAGNLSTLAANATDLSTVTTPITTTTTTALSTLSANLKVAIALILKSIQTLTTVKNGTSDPVEAALFAFYGDLPNANRSESNEYILEDDLTASALANKAECFDNTITELKSIIDQYTTIVNDIAVMTATGTLSGTSVNSYITIVAQACLKLTEIKLNFLNCLVYTGGRAHADFMVIVGEILRWHF